MSARAAVVLGKETSDHLRIEILRRAWPEAQDRWDGNWLTTRITTRVGAFRGDLEADLRAEDFTTFRAALSGLHQRLDGTAVFSTMEYWLRMEVEGDGRGHFTAACSLHDRAGGGNELRFSLTFDQTDVAAMLDALDAIAAAYPVRGVD